MSDATIDAFNWPESATRLCRNVREDRLHFKVERFLSSQDCQRVLVACSGGADSVYMLCMLWAQAATFGIQLTVAHYNHRWRGKDSEKDAEFVKAMARQLQCPFVTDERPEGKSAMTETSARDLRIDFLRTAAKAHNCQCIAFGHQQSDVLETQLQRLARGSGVDGLAAPRPVHYFDTYPTHIRPLLHLTAGTIRGALQMFEIVWCEDVSNQDIKIPRNALRQSVIPALQDALEHDIKKGAARSRELLEEDAVALDQLTRKFIPEAFANGKVLKREALCAVPRALARRAINAWLSKHQLSASLNAVAFQQLIDVITSEKETFRLSAGVCFIEVDAASIRIEPADFTTLPLKPCSVKAGESVVLSTGAALETVWMPVDERLRSRLSNGTIDVNHEAYITSEAAQNFQVRSRRPGDSFRPLGAPGSKKLKSWFIDRKIPVRERNVLPLVTISPDVIVWVPGLPPADDLKINDETKLALKLTYKSRKSL